MRTKYSLFKQSFLSISFVLLVALISYFVSDILGYKVVALLLLLAVSILAMASTKVIALTKNQIAVEETATI